MSTVALSIGLTEPIGEWATLVETVRAWTNRDDLTDLQITEFIAIFEARMNRVLRHPEMEEIVTSTLGAGNNDLPTDYLAMRAIYYNDRELDCMSPSALVAAYGNAASTPCAYTILGGNPRKIRLAPSGDALVTMVYFKRLEGVNENNSDNWLLNEHPDLYLYGTLLAAEAYLANDDRLSIWKRAYDEALAELLEGANRDQYGSAPLVPRGSGQVWGARA